MAHWSLPRPLWMSMQGIVWRLPTQLVWELIQRVYSSWVITRTLSACFFQWGLCPLPLSESTPRTSHDCRTDGGTPAAESHLSSWNQKVYPLRADDQKSGRWQFSPGFCGTLNSQFFSFQNTSGPNLFNPSLCQELRVITTKVINPVESLVFGPIARNCALETLWP